MKICKNCGANNKDENNFCCQCGATEFEPAALQPIPQPFVQTPPPRVKPEITKFDLCTIFGFVASIVGLFEISLVLEPLALITSIIGFVKGSRWRGIAVAGVVVAGIGLLLRLFNTLYSNGVIPQWLIAGTWK